jgi:hypothetical protein
LVTPADAGLDGLAHSLCSPDTRRDLLPDNESHFCLSTGTMANILASPGSDTFILYAQEGGCFGVL